MFLLLTLNISRTFSSVSIGDFEQVNINLEALETFTISNNKSDIRMNTGKYFWRKFTLAHLLLALPLSANLMQEMPFYFKLMI